MMDLPLHFQPRGAELEQIRVGHDLHALTMCLDDQIRQASGMLWIDPCRRTSPVDK